MKRVAGEYERLGSLETFIPYPLPPANPPLLFSSELKERHQSALARIEKLNEIAVQVPEVYFFTGGYAIREALLSSAIEDVHTTVAEVVTYPLMGPEYSTKDTHLVVNYIKALDYALDLLNEEGLPISSRVLLQTHAALMEGEGNSADPGNYRKQGVRVGSFVPAAAPKVPALMADLEHYINQAQREDTLIKAGLAHVQFEAIHPFKDGNGRLGRLLIILILVSQGALKKPILYPSYYFKKERDAYYQALNRAHTEGDFEGWLLFYLKAIELAAEDAYKRAVDINILNDQCKAKIEATFFDDLETAQILFDFLWQFPIFNFQFAAEKLPLKPSTLQNICKKFTGLGILQLQHEADTYRFAQYFTILEKEY